MDVGHHGYFVGSHKSDFARIVPGHDNDSTAEARISHRYGRRRARRRRSVLDVCGNPGRIRSG